MNIISRQDANQQNLTRYYTGIACKNGHNAERFVSTWSCVECVNNRKKKYYRDNKTTCDVRDNKWKKENKDLVNKHSRDWHKNNPEYGLSMSNQRRAAKTLAIPKWYDSEKPAITAIYKQAKHLTQTTKIIHHVDHIIPLRHGLVCGLHCLNNLQILTESENLTKSNNFTPNC